MGKTGSVGLKVGRTIFVYEGGRERRWSEALRGAAPAEFFYGAVEWKRQGETVEIVDWPGGRGRQIFRWLGRAVAGWLPPKTRLEDLWSAWCLLPQLRGADWVVGSTSATAFALAFWKKLGGLGARLAGIHCGIVNCVHAARPRRAAAWLGGAMEKLVFADAEIAEMRRQFAWQDVRSLWFGADAEFWREEVGKERRGILAVGNDARRDYATLVEVARRRPDWSFRFLTRRELEGNLPENLEVVSGDWKAEGISDAELRRLYSEAACVVVPLLDAVQPAGQSVAMQAMLCGTPVVVTRTRGWWGAEVLLPGRDLETATVGDVEGLGGAIAKAMIRDGKIAREVLLQAEWTSAGWAKRLRQAGVGML